MLDRIEFLLGEALVSLRRNTWMTFAAITTTAMALLLLGGLAYLYLEINRYASQLTGRFEMRAFMREGLTEAELKAVGEKIGTIPGVKTVTFVSKDEGLKRFAAQNPGIPVESLGYQNPLPDAFDIKVSDLGKAKSVADAVAKLPEVEKDDGVNYSEDVQDFLSKGMRLVSWVGVLMGCLMLLTSGVLIYNAIRLTIMARRNEFRRMLLVGATRATVVIPLLIEGVIQGALGGFLAGLLMWPGHTTFQRVLFQMSGVHTDSGFPVVGAVCWLSVAGAFYGLVCSAISARETRNVA